MAFTDVCFSNRPVWVKRFQTIHQCCVDVAHGRALLFGIGTKALPSWGPRTRRNNLRGGLDASQRQVQADIRSHLIHRPARDIMPPRGGARVLLIGFDVALLCCCGCLPGPAELGAINPDAMHDDGQPARASATTAFFRPRRLAICIAQTLSQDHRVERTSRIWAAS